MALQLRRPILIGGLGLTFGAWLLDRLDFSVMDFSSTAVWGAIALGSGIWWWNQQGTTKPIGVTPIDRTAVEKALATVESRIHQLATEIGATADASEPVAQLRQRVAELMTDMDRQDIRLAIAGSKAVGKTTLSHLLKINGLPMEASTSSEESDKAASPLTSEVEMADLVIFVTTSDLTDSEFQTIQPLMAEKHRILLVFNKQDHYLPGDRPVVLQQLRDRVQDYLPVEDVVAIAAQPAPVVVRQQQPDGSIQERMDQPAPDIASLQERLGQILTLHGQELILATVLRQAQTLNRSVQVELNSLRRDRALPVIEQYQWIAAAAAFANPVPTLDLLATATINAQLFVDLGAIYQQQFSLEQAKTIMSNLASQMVKLGLVEMATQAIAPLLKSHALTYVAGGTLQGISAAYLTRLAGLSLVEYFEEQSQYLNTSASPFQIDRLVQKLKAVFETNQRSAFLQNLVSQGIAHLLPKPVSVSTNA
ncbi:MAG: DUF697 domain-containing protein [Cyanobacteria bacterium CRU_2_1]|nr:DUF697 domain-containing protein [Cyanobacteria bacterium RU_5_0]NJR62426.1 DUF697 domain-containing protein [Cyanobacteria bacterium CRU_2_1]